MAIATNTHTFYFLARNGKVYQINGVVKITIGSPLIANGTFRDSPPVVTGGAGSAIAIGTSAQAEMQIAGGVSPTSSVTENAGPPARVSATASGASSVAQDDSFLHVDLRFVFSPMALIFFQTDAAIATNPTSATFSKTRPATDFAAFDVDCVFPWNEDCGVFNAPPVGWTATDSR